MTEPNYVDPTGHMPQWFQELGAQFEDKLQQLTGAIKNGRIFPSQDYGFRRPDFFLWEDWVVETKNTARQYWTNQLKGLQQNAKSLDRRLLVVVNETTKIGEKFISQVEREGGKIIRMTRDGTFTTLAGETIKDLATFLGASTRGITAPIFIIPEEILKDPWMRSEYEDLIA